jgi:hypothetical protein
MRYVKFVFLGLVALVTFKVAFTLMGETGSVERNGHGLIVEPKIVNLGDVVYNKSIAFTFSMHNSGQKTTKLAGIERSCGCISAYPAKDTCQPGETVSIKGTLNANKLGRFRYSIRLIEEDNSAPEHTIEVVGNAAASTGSAPPSGSANP